MELRKRYLRRLAERNKNRMNEEEANTHQVEEKDYPIKVEKHINKPNLYLQKLLAKNNNSLNNSINLASVNESLPSFATNIRDILSKEENKKKAIKYLIQKRNEQKYSSNKSIPTDNEQEESNPVLSNKYYQYLRNININDNNKTEFQKSEPDSNFTYPHNYDKEDNYDQEYKIRKEKSIDLIKKRVDLSSSRANTISNDAIQQNIINSSVYLKNRFISQNINEGIYKTNKDDIKEKEEKAPPRIKYYRGYKRFENEQNDTNEPKEENIMKDKEKNTVPTNLKLGNNLAVEKYEDKSNDNDA